MHLQLISGKLQAISIQENPLDILSTHTRWLGVSVSRILNELHKSRFTMHALMHVCTRPNCHLQLCCCAPQQHLETKKGVTLSEEDTSRINRFFEFFVS